MLQTMKADGLLYSPGGNLKARPVGTIPTLAGGTITFSEAARSTPAAFGEPADERRSLLASRSSAER